MRALTELSGTFNFVHAAWLNGGVGREASAGILFLESPSCLCYLPVWLSFLLLPQFTSVVTKQPFRLAWGL